MLSQRFSCCSVLCHLHRQSNPWLCLAAPREQPEQASRLKASLAPANHTRYRTRATVQQQHSANAGNQPQHPRFYAPQLPLSLGSSVELEPEEAKHAVRVLRLKPGDHVELCDGRGGLALCEVVHTDKNSARVAAISEPWQVSWQGPKWVLAAACLTLKGGRTDWLIEKATELGAYAVLPLITDRSQTGTTKSKFKSISKASKAADANMPTAANTEFQPGRLQRLALAATKQSLRAHALQLLPAQPLCELLPMLQQSPISLVGTAGAPPVLQVLQKAMKHREQHPQQLQDGQHQWEGQTCYLLVGPEGDFTPEEVSAVMDAGVHAVGLGSNRLRTETAALALLTAAVLGVDASRG